MISPKWTSIWDLMDNALGAPLCFVYVWMSECALLLVNIHTYIINIILYYKKKKKKFKAKMKSVSAVPVLLFCIVVCLLFVVVVSPWFFYIKKCCSGVVLWLSVCNSLLSPLFSFPLLEQPISMPVSSSFA